MSNVENKEQISIVEFKAWLTGLIRGKGGALPDLDDWKEIKKMLDKVQDESDVQRKSTSPSILEEIFRKKIEEKEERSPYTPPYTPWTTPNDIPPWTTPNDIPPWKLTPSTPMPNFPRIGDIPPYVTPYVGDVVPLRTTGGCSGVVPDNVWIGDDLSNLKERISSSISASSINASEMLTTGTVVSSHLLENTAGSLEDTEEKKKRSKRKQRRLRGPHKVVAVRHSDGTVHKELMDSITHMIERNENNGPKEEDKTKNI